MLDFTAIDFETANKYANSACSLAAVTMNDDRCVKEGYTLIRPPFMVFDSGNIQIHGITPDQVAHKPKFDALWDRIRPHLEGRILVAHYAVFDTRVLRSLLKTYHLEKPQASYACTVEISRRVWPDLPNHKLDTVASITIRPWTTPAPVPTSSSKPQKSSALRPWKNSSRRRTSS
jgi:DNA polymerase-3 subunit epsilon